MNKFRYIFGLSSFMLLAVTFLSSGIVGCQGGIKEIVPIDTTHLPVDPIKPFVRLLEKESVDSKILGTTVSYAVLLPEHYDASKDSYPVVYLLHGYGDNQTGWYNQWGQIQTYVDLYSTEIVPAIYVMPMGYETYYVNKFDGTIPYMDFFTNELVPAIDSKYRTKKDKTQRAVMGYSMGAFGAIILPMLNPTIFGTSVPLSISMRTEAQYMAESQSGWNSQWGKCFGGIGLTGTARLTDYYKTHNPLSLFGQADVSKYADLRYFIDCGDDEESLDISNGALHNLMASKNIRHEYRVRNGAHDWVYWHGALHEALLFISSGFSGQGYPQEPTPVNIGTPVAAQEYLKATISGTEVGLFKPASYSTANSYPVIYFVHDFTGADRTANAMKYITLLNNAMVAGKIPNSIVIEIPYSAQLNSTLMNAIMDKINADYKIVGNKGGKVLMGNNLGGATVCSLMADFITIFNGCFLFDAKLTSDAVYQTFYYVDMPDKSANYTGNYNLYLALKSSGKNREYRIRQGTSSLQSNLNGLDGSMGYLNARLKAM